MIALKQIKLDAVVKVYNGKANACMCGCSGRYTVPTKEIADDINKRYKFEAISADEISMRSVKIAVNKINKALKENPDSVTVADNLNWVDLIIGNRQTTVYFKD